MQNALAGTIRRQRSLDPIETALFLIAGFAFVSVFAPLVVIVLSSLSPTSQPSIPPSGLSLRWYWSVLQDDNMMGGLRWSFLLASGSSIIATIVGTASAIALDRSSFPGKSLVNGVLLSPMVFPTLILGAAILVFSQVINFTPIMRLILAHSLLGVPFVIRMVLSSLAMFDRTIEEAARIHGASDMRAFAAVTMPAIKGGVLAGAIFAFITSFGEVNASLFLTGPGVTTLPIHIFSELQFGVGQIGIAAISTIQMILVGALMLGLDKLLGISFVSVKSK